MPSTTSPIKETLDRWGKDMVAAKAKGNRATVEFRFSRRQDDATTAFEAGIFRYTVIEKSGTRTSKCYPFEALLGKTNGKWRVLMERQFAEVPPAGMGQTGEVSGALPDGRRRVSGDATG
jgi:hypothetical protein